MKRISRYMFATVLVGVVALGAAACGDDDDDAGNRLNVTLRDWAIDLKPATVPAGEVEIRAKNNGSTAHEVIVIRTDLPADKLPYDDAANKVIESELDVIGEIEQFAAGESEEGSFTLSAGRYVLICNIATHYELGMHTVLTVQ
ncbi:sulfocyanin-like copper-binding protein [Tepidiforma sp.]|uniref:sulfocyanin-like copper-binding protein n=1 Tax=Tepidiforma sp. TaxID=2682230 RepID=UPI002ADD6E38|nr:sulfocyanin-like copper-binding protein [Tepidiforma sp.]